MELILNHQFNSCFTFVRCVGLGLQLLHRSKRGILPGIGKPAFASFTKYFCTLDWTCSGVRPSNSEAIFRYLSTVCYKWNAITSARLATT